MWSLLFDHVCDHSLFYTSMESQHRKFDKASRGHIELVRMNSWVYSMDTWRLTWGSSKATFTSCGVNHHPEILMDCSFAVWMGHRLGRDAFFFHLFGCCHKSMVNAQVACSYSYGSISHPSLSLRVMGPVRRNVCKLTWHRTDDAASHQTRKEAAC